MNILQFFIFTLFITFITSNNMATGRIKLEENVCHLIEDLAVYWQSKSIITLMELNKNVDYEVLMFIKNCLNHMLYLGTLSPRTIPPFYLNRNSIIVAQNNDLVQEVLKKPSFWDFKYILLNVNDRPNVFIPSNCELLIVFKESSTFILKEIWQIATDSQISENIWGFWSNKLGLQTPQENLHDRRRNLNGYNFNLLFQTQFGVQRYKTRENIFEMLQTAYNFTITYKGVNRGESLKLSNGTATGLHKILKDNDAQVTSIIYGITSERLDKMSFFWLNVMSTSNLYIAEKPKFDENWFTRPFAYKLRLGLLIWILASITLVATILYFGQGISPLQAFSDAFLQIVASTNNQWTTLSVNYKNTFLLVLVPYLATGLLNPAFSGAARSFLTSPISKLPFQNIDGLIENGEYLIHTDLHGFYHKYLLSNASTAQTIRHKRLLAENFSLTSWESFFKICSNPYMAHLDDDTTTISKPLPCRIVKIPGDVFRLPIGFLIQDDFPYQKSMSLTIRKLQESGLKGYYRNQWVVEDEILDAQSIGMDVVISLFKGLGIVYFLSIAILCIEVITNKYYYGMVNKEERTSWLEFYKKN